MRPLIIAGMSVLVLATVARAQGIPGLGADRAVGSAGAEAIALPGTLGLPPNPADVGGHGRWSVGLGASSAPLTDIVERSITGSMRVYRVRFAARITSRWVRNVFDDPALGDGPDLRVGGDDYALGAAVEPADWIRVGVTTVFANARVLGSRGSGVGYKLGVVVSRPWVSAGVTYGDADIAMTWRFESGAGGRERTQGTRRLAVGVGTSAISVAGLAPQLAVEWNRDAGYNDDTWLRVQTSVGILGSSLRFVAGAAKSTSQSSVSYLETGVIATFGWSQLQMGMRFGADPAPGNSVTVGLGVVRR